MWSMQVEKAPVKKHTDCLSNEGGNTDPNEPRFMPSRTGEAAGEATQTLHAKHQQVGSSNEGVLRHNQAVPIAVSQLCLYRILRGYKSNMR